MPPQMGKLTKLQKLTDFIVGKHSGSSIKELGGLQNLRGELHIQKLENIVDARDASRANLKDKKHIKKLMLVWSGATDDSRHERDVLEQFQFPTNLECLVVCGYGGTRFPGWLGDSSLSKLVSLELQGCRYCSSLPSLGQLPSLEDLQISSFDGIVSLGPEFYGSGKSMLKPFRSLKTLKFSGMLQWREWEVENGAFQLLQTLDIVACPNLIGSLPVHLPSLTTLNISGCKQLVVSLPRAPMIQIMRIIDNSGSVELRELSTGLHKLTVYNFHSIGSLFKGVMQTVDLFSSLEVVEIRDNNSLDCFPSELFPNLRNLGIERCENLKSLGGPESTVVIFRSLVSLEIKQCSNLTSFSKERVSSPNPAQQNCSSFPVLRNLCIRECPRLTEGLPSHLPCLTALEIKDSLRDVKVSKLSSGLYSFVVKRLHYQFLSLDSLQEREGLMGFLSTKIGKIDIADCDSLKFFSLGLFPRLQKLRLVSCHNLQSIGPSGVIHGDFTSLISIEISNCSKLVSFPKGGLLGPNLTRLSLWSCSNLKSLPKNMIFLLHSLEELRIAYCPELESFPEKGLPSSLSSLCVYNCAKLGSFPKGGLPSKLKILHIDSCSKLIRDRKQWNLQMLPSLLHFSIGGCREEDMESFPGEMMLPSTLITLTIGSLENLKCLDCEGLQHLTCLGELEISNCSLLQTVPQEGLPSSLSCLKIRDIQNMTSLNNKGLQQLTSLRKLEIEYCPNLQCIPAEGLPTTISFLSIWGCPLLEKRCQRENGDDWSKISHIPHIEINCHKITRDKFVMRAKDSDSNLFPML